MNVDWTHDEGERGHTTVQASVDDNGQVTLTGLEGYEFRFTLGELLDEVDVGKEHP